MSVKGKRGRELFVSGYYCAESVLKAVAESRGVSSPVIPRIATGFCSGMSRTAGLCGAVTGGVMSLGLALGRDRPEDDQQKCYDAVGQLMETFREKYGTCECTVLLGCDIGTPGGQEIFAKKNLVESVCLVVTEDVTRLVLEMLDKKK